MEPEEVVALSVATRPDCLPPEILDLLAELNRRKPVWVELGLQTIHPESAAYLRRGYELPVFEGVVRGSAGAGYRGHRPPDPGHPRRDPGGHDRKRPLRGTVGGRGEAPPAPRPGWHGPRGGVRRRPGCGRWSGRSISAFWRTASGCCRRLWSSTASPGTGDKRRLLAPLWSADKKAVLNAMRRRFEADGLVQGSALGE